MSIHFTIRITGVLTMRNKALHCIGFSACVETSSRILILGSMPSVASLAATEYYAHPQNRFWPLMAQLLGEGIAPRDYQERLAMLMRHGIALWDVIDTCDREGSLDTAIKNETANNIAAFLEKWPAIHTIGLNGGKAYSSFTRHNKALLGRSDLRIIKLPSTSPANARWRLNHLIDAWQALWVDRKK